MSETPTKKFKVAVDTPAGSSASDAAADGEDQHQHAPSGEPKSPVKEKLGTLWQVPKPKLFVSGMEKGPQTVSKLNSDPNINITASRASHHAGYRQARASYGVSEGSVYFEVRRVELQPGEGALRVGWASTFSPLDVPTGFDLHSYGMSTATGKVITASMPTAYTHADLDAGDIVGCHIHLPPRGVGDELPLVQYPPNPTCVETEDANFWNCRIIKDVPYILPKAEPILRPHQGSFVQFYIQGKPQGVAFTNIPVAEYFPTVALYKSEVQFNFGPTFKYPPQGLTNYTPASALGEKE